MSYVYHADRPERLTVEFLEQAYASLSGRAAEAEVSLTADAWIALLIDWNALRAYYVSEGARINFRLFADFTNEAATEAEEYFREQVVPVIEKHDEPMLAAICLSRHRPALEARFGAYFFQRIDMARRTIDPINAELRLREGELQTRYERLLSTAEVTVDGETMTTEQADSLLASPDRDVRRAAYVAVAEWNLANRDELAGIFDELVRVRTAMGRNLGDGTYTRLGYAAMERTDYGPEDTALFRRHLFEHLLPIARALSEEHAERIGVARLSVIDQQYDPGRTLPQGIAKPVETQLERASRLFGALAPELGAHFDRMAGGGMIDHPNRPGKYPGAFCTPFYDEGRCAVMLNAVGDARDVEVLLHELGHAFQKLESEPIELIDSRNPTTDLAEIHSTTMEFLGIRHLDEFFAPDDIARYRRNAWTHAIRSLVAIARVDEFQHWVYEHPEATSEEREAKYVEIATEYSAGLDFSGYEKYRGVSWYQVGHLFSSPFYMIDYALAQIVSLELALADLRDHDETMRRYLELCRLGGTKSFTAALEHVGLRSPFDESVIAGIGEHVQREIVAAV